MNPTIPQPQPQTQSGRTFNDVLSSKSFLNKPYHHSDGSIFTEISVVEDGKIVDIYTKFKIRDCERAANLSFDCIDENAYKNCIYKCKTLIKHIKEFKRSLKRARQLQLELQNK